MSTDQSGKQTHSAKMMLDLLNPLRSYRNDRKLSVQDLADAIEVPRSTMVAIEDGRRTISPAQRDVLAERLKLEPAKLDYLVQADET